MCLCERRGLLRYQKDIVIKTENFFPYHIIDVVDGVKKRILRVLGPKEMQEVLGMPF